MKNSSLLSLLLVLVAASPLATGASSRSRRRVSCRTGGSYTANSTYEANLRRLAAVLPAEAAAAPHRRRYGYALRGVGYWPNRLQAGWSCRASDGADCAACIADAFKSVERRCPFRREAFFSGGGCSLRLSEYRILGTGSDAFGSNSMTQMLVMGMIFQAFGLSCIFFLFLQAWRHDIKKGAIVRHTPLLSGDQ